MGQYPEFDDDDIKHCNYDTIKAALNVLYTAYFSETDLGGLHIY